MSTLASVVLYDVMANRPAAGVAGRLFFATDTGKIYRDSGTVWNAVSAASLPDMPPMTAGSLDDEFDGTALGAAWAWNNQGTATVAFGASRIIGSANSVTVQSTHGIVQTAPATPWSVTTKIAGVWDNASNVGDGCGLGVMDAVTGKVVIQALGCPSQGQTYLYNLHQDTPTGSWTIVHNYAFNFAMAPYIYFRVQDDGTNINWSYSFDGYVFTRNYWTEARTSYLANGPGKVGLFWWSAGQPNTSQIASDWFRRTQ